MFSDNVFLSKITQKRGKYGWIAELMNNLLSWQQDSFGERKSEKMYLYCVGRITGSHKNSRTGCDMTQMHYSFKLPLCLQVKDLLVHLQFSFFFSSNTYHSLSPLSIQHHVVGISGDLEGLFYHLVTRSCIPIL